jgi:hypothetical protein
MTKVERDDVQVETVQSVIATEDGMLVEAASRGYLAPGRLVWCGRACGMRGSIEPRITTIPASVWRT